LLYYLNWIFETRINKNRIPLNSSIILTDECNLHCRHCTVAHLGYPKQNFSSVTEDIDNLYNLGSRMLVITGGEPFLWRDDSGKNVEDVVRYARSMGFFRVVICTNGTLPLQSGADFLWVSLDGFQEEHESLRGSIYGKVVANIARSHHRGIFINFTISNGNERHFEKSAEKILSLPNVRGILFHLYTKYIGGNDSLSLQDSTRANILRRLAAFKKRHPLRTFNTFAGLHAMIKNNWQRGTWASVTINQGQLTECCCRSGISNDSVCHECGCSPAVETWVLASLKFSAFIENLRYL